MMRAATHALLLLGTVLKWASGFYFGGTSTAPQRITGWILE